MIRQVQLFVPACFLHIKSWVHIIYIPLVKLFAEQLQCFTKALEVYDLTLPEEFDHIIDIRIIA